MTAWGKLNEARVFPFVSVLCQSVLPGNSAHRGGFFRTKIYQVLLSGAVRMAMEPWPPHWIGKVFIYVSSSTPPQSWHFGCCLNPRTQLLFRRCLVSCLGELLSTDRCLFWLGCWTRTAWKSEALVASLCSECTYFFWFSSRFWVPPNLLAFIPHSRPDHKYRLWIHIPQLCPQILPGHLVGSLCQMKICVLAKLQEMPM